MLDFIINPIAGGKHGKRTRKVVSILKRILEWKKLPFNINLILNITVYIVLPGIFALITSELMRKAKIIKFGDMTLDI